MCLTLLGPASRKRSFPKPIPLDVGAFTNTGSEKIRYRSVFLPVIDNGCSVTHLIGAFS
jgi:hypothetical protein